MARVTEMRRLPLADMAVLLLVAGLLWVAPLLLGSHDRPGQVRPVALRAVSADQADVVARAEVLALALALPADEARVSR